MEGQSSADMRERNPHEPESDHVFLETDYQTNTVVWLVDKVHWVFEPVLPLYGSVKSSSSFAKKCITFFKNLALLFIYELVGFLSKAYAKGTTEIRNLKISERKDSFVKEAEVGINSIIDTLFKLLCRIREMLLLVVNYIEMVYEDVVPVPPGFQSWNTIDKDNLSIRERCFYATLNMASRVCYYSKMFLQQTFTFFNNQNITRN